MLDLMHSHTETPEALPPPALLTPHDVARQLGVDVGTLARWRTLGRGPRFVKLGDGRSAHVRYRPADVDAYIEACAR